MSIPGFTAHTTLRTAAGRSYGGDATAAWSAPQPAITAQNVPCDIAIRCINGVRYMTRDCPDGSGETIIIGRCGPLSHFEPFPFFGPHAPHSPVVPPFLFPRP